MLYEPQITKICFIASSDLSDVKWEKLDRKTLRVREILVHGGDTSCNMDGYFLGGYP